MDNANMVETARIVRKIGPYDDGSGHRHTIQVVRKVNQETQLAGMEVQIGDGADAVTIDIDYWEAVKKAIDQAIAYGCDCGD